MKRIAFAVTALLAALAAPAQIYQWLDENNKTVISDRPPVGKVRHARIIEADEPAAGEAGKTLADREIDFRKRQKESREGADKAEKDAHVAALRRENCDAARRALQTLESGERLAMRDSKGERYYLDDAQREQEIAKARQAAQASCQ
ncbi:DUF4124 domain-containing protein [Candidatus Accumulibacter sp. ACC003]|uniref:DUF4124 domain-containing protein n=1 Tax=Candidatus Accumulibacter sp. ACC003 TaxID=2823334 RepID=UPI0025C15D00|nr:DUF4124 domain-containing protein [Candidatus Accumulibacter sp. ACC003]